MGDAMPDPIICLNCGGVLDAQPHVAAARMRPCRCTPSLKEARSVRCPGCGGSIKVGTRACPYCSSTVATCRCAACLAWNLAGAAHCQACGKPLLGEQGAGQAAGCNCPRCGARLQAREYADMSVDECDRCGGLFIPPAMMDRIVTAHDRGANLCLALPQRAVNREAKVQYIQCPVCGKMMNRQAFGRYSGVIVDICKAHGLWFDSGELAEVIRFVQRGGLERKREREREELAERERRLRVQMASAEAAAQFGGDESGFTIRWSSNNLSVADLLYSLVKDRD
jgi:Zn-finger nucleic acid-binding protein